MRIEIDENLKAIILKKIKEMEMRQEEIVSWCNKEKESCAVSDIIKLGEEMQNLVESIGIGQRIIEQGFFTIDY